MRFFTREWHGGDMPDAEAKLVPSRYEEHLAALGERFPDDARRLWGEVSLHDGWLRSVEKTDDHLELVIRIGETSTGYFDARLSYQDVELSGSDEHFLRHAAGHRDVGLLYDEFDSAGTDWVHRFLFWPYYDVSVQFGGFTLALAPPEP